MQQSAEHVISALQESHPARAEVAFRDLLSGVSHVFFAHKDFVVHYTHVDTDFIYDKQANLYLAGIPGHHVDLMAALFWYRGGVESDKYEAADRFILDGHGLFKSRAGNRIYRGPTFVVPAELRAIARDIEVLS